MRTRASLARTAACGASLVVPRAVHVLPSHHGDLVSMLVGEAFHIHGSFVSLHKEEAVSLVLRRGQVLRGPCLATLPMVGHKLYMIHGSETTEPLLHLRSRRFKVDIR